MDAFNQALGENIRAARRTKGLSLLEVEEASGSEFKASVLGAYERGERSMSVARLIRLASLYEVSPATLLPAEAVDEDRSVVVDLDMTDSLSEDKAEMIDGFLAAIQRMRQDAGGAGLTVRKSDLRVLTALIGQATSSAVGEGDDR